MPSLPLRTVSTRTLAIAAVALVLFEVILIVVFLNPHNGLPGRGAKPFPLQHIFLGGPVVQLELVRSAKDIDDILATGNIEANVTDARLGNACDTYLFIPGYTALLLVLALLISRGAGAWGARLFWLAAVAIIATAACDWAENAGIDRALDHIAASHHAEPGDANRISRPSIVKWSLSSVILLVLGIFAVRQRSPLRVVLGVLLLIEGAAVLVQLIVYFPQRPYF
jgi:hypothetical protein